MLHWSRSGWLMSWWYHQSWLLLPPCWCASIPLTSWFVAIASLVRGTPLVAMQAFQRQVLDSTWGDGSSSKFVRSMFSLGLDYWNCYHNVFYIKLCYLELLFKSILCPQLVFCSIWDETFFPVWSFDAIGDGFESSLQIFETRLWYLKSQTLAWVSLSISYPSKL
jgi:hypothetical protein